MRKNAGRKGKNQEKEEIKKTNSRIQIGALRLGRKLETGERGKCVNREQEAVKKMQSKEERKSKADSMP